MLTGSDLALCPDCGSDNIIRSDVREQIICRDCGLIFEPLAPAEGQTARQSKKSAAVKKKRR